MLRLSWLLPIAEMSTGADEADSELVSAPRCKQHGVVCEIDATD